MPGQKFKCCVLQDVEDLDAAITSSGRRLLKSYYTVYT